MINKYEEKVILRDKESGKMVEVIETPTEGGSFFYEVVERKKVQQILKSEIEDSEKYEMVK